MRVAVEFLGREYAVEGRYIPAQRGDRGYPGDAARFDDDAEVWTTCKDESGRTVSVEVSELLSPFEFLRESIVAEIVNRAAEKVAGGTIYA